MEYSFYKSNAQGFEPSAWSSGGSSSIQDKLPRRGAFQIVFKCKETGKKA